MGAAAFLVVSAWLVGLLLGLFVRLVGVKG